MNKEQAENIITFMKEGHTYSKDDFFEGDIKYWSYDEKSKQFHFEHYGTVVGLFLDEYFYTEEEFLKYLMEYHSYEGFKSGLFKGDDF